MFTAFQSEIDPDVWYVGDEHTAFLRTEIGAGNAEYHAKLAAAGMTLAEATPARTWTPWGGQPVPANDSFCDRVLGQPAPDVKAAIADEAKRIVTGARRSAYGKPEDNFERIARFWQAYFANTGRAEANVTAADVSPLMRLMKEARLCETPDHRDSFVDLVGYTLTGAEINGVAA